MLNAISAVCEAFCASLLAVSKHIKPSSMLSRVLFILVNKFCPNEYDAEKLLSTWQERREPLQVNMYKRNSMDIYRGSLRKQLIMQEWLQKQRRPTSKKTMAFTLIAPWWASPLLDDSIQCFYEWPAEQCNMAKYSNLSVYPKAHLGVHFSSSFVFCKLNNSKTKECGCTFKALSAMFSQETQNSPIPYTLNRLCWSQKTNFKSHRYFCALLSTFYPQDQINFLKTISRTFSTVVLEVIF